ncbi:MAG: YihY/virulence factor BrkB family protein, partial [Betaproteobacteria bacterium]|nr:YihY/virulence factor BrkB family protein [Betaproteobacteria bacterium]
APLLIIVIAVAGFVFGQEAVQGEIAAQLGGLIGEEGAVAVQGLVESANEPKEGIIATVISVVILVIGATTVFGELQSSLDRIWRVPAPPDASGILNLLRSRLFSFGMVLGLGFLLLVSLVASAGLSAFGNWWGGAFGGWEALLHVLNLVISFALITGLFAMIYKIMPRAEIAWRDVWVGAAVTALLFEIGKLLIGLYLGKSGVTSGFGAAGSLVVLLVWVYYSAQIFLLGAEFTWVYAREHGSKVSEPEPVSAPIVPSHSGETAAPLNARDTAPVTTSQVVGDRIAVAPVVAKGADIVSRPGDFIEQNPIKGLGIAVTVGLVAGAVLRHIAPPARLFGRSPIARGRRLFWRLFPLKAGKLF